MVQPMIERTGVRIVLLAAGLLTAVAASGCDKDSTELGTKDIEADFTVDFDNANGKQETKIEARLKESEASATGPQGDVNLTGGDTLSVTTDKNENLPMPRESAGHYRVILPNLAATVFTFHLKRAAASSTTVFTMPGPIALTDSPAGKSFAAGDTLHFAWSNKATGRSASPAKILVSGSHYPCGGAALNLSQKKEVPFDDTGSMDVPIAQLYSTGAPAAGDCVDVEIRRTVTADADAAFDKASSVTGTRTDRLQIKVN
jgi:hypothetical protein